MTAPHGARPAFLIVALGAMTPSVVFADPVAAAVTWPSDCPSGGGGSLALPIAVLMLIAAAVLLVSGRIGWRIAAMLIVGGGALFGSDAMLDGAWTAIAVSR